MGKFCALFLVPDLALLAYVAGPKVGGAAYDVAHSYVGPLLMLSLGYERAGVVSLALIWTAHSGFDRLLGYGLKYPDGFAHTHQQTLATTLD